MAKRHQSSRRRTYGRRQHELRERAYRRPDTFEIADESTQTESDRLGWLDVSLSPRRLTFAVGD